MLEIAPPTRLAHMSTTLLRLVLTLTSRPTNHNLCSAIFKSTKTWAGLGITGSKLRENGVFKTDSHLALLTRFRDLWRSVWQTMNLVQSFHLLQILTIASVLIWTEDILNPLRWCGSYPMDVAAGSQIIAIVS